MAKRHVASANGASANGDEANGDEANGDEVNGDEAHENIVLFSINPPKAKNKNLSYSHGTNVSILIQTRNPTSIRCNQDSMIPESVISKTIEFKVFFYRNLQNRSILCGIMGGRNMGPSKK